MQLTRWPKIVLNVLWSVATIGWMHSTKTTINVYRRRCNKTILFAHILSFICFFPVVFAWNIIRFGPCARVSNSSNWMRIWTTLVRNVYVRNDVTCIKINGKLRHAFQFFIWVFSNSSCSHTFSAAFCSFDTVSIAYIAITQMTMTHWRHIKKLLKLWWQFF